QDAGAEVSLRVDGPEAGRLRRQDVLAEPARGAEALAEEGGVDGAPVEGPEPGEDLGVRRVEPAREGAAGRVEDLGEPVRAVPFRGRHGSGEEQGMAAQNGGLPTRPQPQADHGASPKALTPQTISLIEPPKKEAPRLTRGALRRRSVCLPYVRQCSEKR